MLVLKIAAPMHDCPLIRGGPFKAVVAPLLARPIGRFGIKKRRKAAFRQAISESRPADKCGLLNTILFERHAAERRRRLEIRETVSQKSLLIPLPQKLIVQTSCQR